VREQYPTVTNGVVVYNDGEVAVQILLLSDKTMSFGSIQRVHSINGQTVEQATRERFLTDLPVVQRVLDDIDKTEDAQWLQEGIAAELEGRQRFMS
jgi:hypothetical protein